MRPTQTDLHAPWMYEFDNESFMKFLNKGSYLAIYPALSSDKPSPRLSLVR